MYVYAHDDFDKSTKLKCVRRQICGRVIGSHKYDNFDRVFDAISNENFLDSY